MSKPNPVGAIERAIGFVEATARRHGIENVVQASMGLSDGERLWAFRYSTEGRSRTLFASADAHSVKHLYPEHERLQRLADGDRLVVSEPVAELPGAWEEIAEASVLVVGPGADETRPFRPHVEPGDVNGARGLDASRA